MKMKPEISSVIVRSVSCGSTSYVCFGNVLIFDMFEKGKQTEVSGDLRWKEKTVCNVTNTISWQFLTIYRVVSHLYFSKDLSVSK